MRPGPGPGVGGAQAGPRSRGGSGAGAGPRSQGGGGAQPTWLFPARHDALSPGPRSDSSSARTQQHASENDGTAVWRWRSRVCGGWRGGLTQFPRFFPPPVLKWRSVVVTAAVHHGKRCAKWLCAKIHKNTRGRLTRSLLERQKHLLLWLQDGPNLWVFLSVFLGYNENVF